MKTIIWSFSFLLASLAVVSSAAGQLSGSSANFSLGVWSYGGGGGYGCSWVSEEPFGPEFQVSNETVGICGHPWAISAGLDGLGVAFDIPEHPVFRWTNRRIESGVETTVEFQQDQRVSIDAYVGGQWADLDLSLSATSSEGTVSSLSIASEGNHAVTWELAAGEYQFVVAVVVSQVPVDTGDPMWEIPAVQSVVSVTWEDVPPMAVETCQWGAIKSLYR